MDLSKACSTKQVLQTHVCMEDVIMVIHIIELDTILWDKGFGREDSHGCLRSFFTQRVPDFAKVAIHYTCKFLKCYEMIL